MSIGECVRVSVCVCLCVHAGATGAWNWCVRSCEGGAYVSRQKMLLLANNANTSCGSVVHLIQWVYPYGARGCLVCHQRS